MLEYKDIMVLLPKSIRIEFIKEEMNRLYFDEITAMKFRKFCKNEMYSLSYYLIHRKDYERHMAYEKLFEVMDGYKNLTEMIKASNLTDEDIKELYIYGKAKKTRIRT